MMADEFLAKYSSRQLTELMAWFKAENTDWEYRRRNLDPVLAQEKLAEMDDEFEEFELSEEIQRMDHADFFKDIALPQKPKLTTQPRQEAFPKQK